MNLADPIDFLADPIDFLMDPWGDYDNLREEITPPSVTKEKIAKLAEVLKTFPIVVPVIEGSELPILRPVPQKADIAEVKEVLNLRPSVGYLNLRKRPRQPKEDSPSDGIRKCWPISLQNLTENLATIGLPSGLIKDIVENCLSIKLSSHGRKTVSKWCSKISLKGKIDDPVLNELHKNSAKVESLVRCIQDEILKSDGAPILDKIDALFKKALHEKA